MNENRKFLVYCAYAIGIPLVIVLVCYVLDSSSWAPSFMQPGFGIVRCFFKRSYPIRGRWIK